MFIGHFALGFGAKRLAPRASLATLIAAAMALDLVWPVLVLAGVEHVRIVPGDTAFTPLAFDSYPYTHSLAGAAVIGLMVALAHLAREHDPRRAWVLAGLVVSHWVLDFATHRPDLQLAPGLEQRYGLGLWNSVPATIAVEVALSAACLALYVRGTRALDRVGSIGMWSFVALLALLYTTAALGPVPPDVTSMAATNLLLAPMFLWIAWFDRHRA